MTDWSAITQRVEGCLPTGAISGADGLPLDEVPARLVCTPTDVGQLRELVRVAAAAQCPIYPLGGRTLLGLGLPGRGEGIGASTLKLDRVIDYPARDMTITVEAGIRVGKLQEMLAAEGQRLPIDVPRAAEATLGGAIATNVSGPRRYGYGTLRDYVIGVGVVDAQGNETRAGGRVVKNVAGYDLCKLYTGSLGTLGIITQVTLKLRPIPEAAGVVWAKFDAIEQVAVAIDRLAASATRPVAIEVLNAAAAEHVAANTSEPLPCRPWIVAIGFEESTEAVRWQCEHVQSELNGLDVWFQSLEGDRARRVLASLGEFQAAQPGAATFKANFLGSCTVEFLDGAQRQPVDWSVAAHAGSGVAFGHVLPPADPEQVQVSLNRLLSHAAALRGNLVVRRCPAAWKGTTPAWGRPRDDMWLMQAIRRKLDPQHLLNPGRFVTDV